MPAGSAGRTATRPQRPLLLPRAVARLCGNARARSLGLPSLGSPLPCRNACSGGNMGGLILARMRCLAMYQLGGIGGTGPALPGPAASPLHDALNAVAAAAHAAITGCRVGQALHGSGKRSFADGQPSGATVQ